MSKWVDMSDVLTEHARKTLRIGHVLVFNFEGSRNEYKLRRRTKNGKMWFEPITLYTPDEVDLVDPDGSRISLASLNRKKRASKRKSQRRTSRNKK